MLPPSALKLKQNQLCHPYRKYKNAVLFLYLMELKIIPTSWAELEPLLIILSWGSAGSSGPGWLETLRPLSNIRAAGSDMEKQKHYNNVAYIAANIKITIFFPITWFKTCLIGYMWTTIYGKYGTPIVVAVFACALKKHISCMFIQPHFITYSRISLLYSL